MLWPLVLPLQITAVIFITLAVTLVAFAPALKRKRTDIFSISLGVTFLLFIPSCMGVMHIVDSIRFGVFRYDDFNQVNDFRVERFLPPKARQIVLIKSAMGHSAHYSITESELRKYVDELWKESSQSHNEPDEHANAEREIDSSDYAAIFPDRNWPIPQKSIEFSGPVEETGRGAQYYFDRATGTASHRGAYW